MKILLTNDDGIQASGLHAIRRALLQVPSDGRPDLGPIQATCPAMKSSLPPAGAKTPLE